MCKMLKIFKKYKKDDEGLALIEGAMIMPILITMIFSMYDIGHAVLVSQKVMSATHIAADLITRKKTVTTFDIDEAIEASMLAIDPYSRVPYGIDIVSIRFGDEDAPEEVWRETRVMGANLDLPGDADGLGLEGEGVVAVTVTYRYEPHFTGIVIGDIDMTEVAFMRGRKSSVVELEE